MLSCFTDISIPDDNKIFRPKTSSNLLNANSLKLQDIIDNIKNFEYNSYIISNDNYNIHYDIQELILEWCCAHNHQQCQIILDKAFELSISAGDFVKAILKISNIVNEICISCELINNISLLEKLKCIPQLILKYVATHNSLYV